MRECGLGTPATRAAILETLLRREYVLRDGKLLQATDKGVSLIGMVHEHVKSPAMTGEWEAKLARIERGEGQLETFHAGTSSATCARWWANASSSSPPAASVAFVSAHLLRFALVRAAVGVVGVGIAPHPAPPRRALGRPGRAPS